MGPPLADDIWKRRGITLLWDAAALAGLCPASRVVSLRQFLVLHSNAWADIDPLLVNDERCLVVAGLEGAIDALLPDEIEGWMVRAVYPAVMSYQKDVAGGGTEAALVFWLADPRRLDYRTGDDTHYWRCGPGHTGYQLPLSRCLFNGAQDGLRRIQGGDPKYDRGVGLFHPRIS